MSETCIWSHLVELLQSNLEVYQTPTFKFLVCLLFNGLFYLTRQRRVIFLLLNSQSFPVYVISILDTIREAHLQLWFERPIWAANMISIENCKGLLLSNQQVKLFQMKIFFLLKLVQSQSLSPGNTKLGSVTVPLTSCCPGLD